MTERDPKTGKFTRPANLTKGMKGRQMDAYYETLRTLSRAVRQAESDVRRYDAVS